MAKKSILIADDDAAIRKLLMRSLKNKDYRLFEASNGKEALAVVRKNPIDLAILDIMMPEMDGVEALKRIKEMDETIEILMLTGHADTDLLKEILFDFGAFDYLLKPFDFDELALLVRKSLNNRVEHLKRHILKKELEDQIRQLKRDFRVKTFELRKSQIKYRNIVESSTDPIVVSQDGYLKFANRKALELTGYSGEEILQIPFDELLHPDDRAEVSERFTNRIKGMDIPPLSTFRIMRKDGSFFWVENNASRSVWGDNPAVLNVIRDITKRKEAEAQLRLQTRRLNERVKELSCLFEISEFVEKPDVSEEEICQENLVPQAMQYPEIACARIILRDQEFKTENFRETPLKFVEHIKVNHQRVGVLEVFYVEEIPDFETEIFVDEERKLIKMIVERIGKISERIRMEALMMRTEKLSSLSHLSAGLAHELRNPLAVISSCSQFCVENMKLERTVRENFQVIYRSSQRASNLIGELLAFAKPDHLKQKEMDINEVLLDVLRMAKLGTDPVHVNFVPHLGKGLPKIVGDKEKLGQVFLNLMENAIQAISGKGKIVLKSQLLAVDDMLEVSVSDNGHGIPEDYRNKIFDPFFTTKDGGTGLGLSICNSIVEQHSGIIHISSSEEGGTRISVRLPVIQEITGGT